ncbi:hypothetical protein HYFRA_00000917 [Hymenoscyphus fraxineus]|uniref:PLAC8 family protein n=1 Tax=Hymenoscyphus fraxineus TaxID=746836 RepID=A0A9N9PR69_9HELO|nr:hypothetical protein HYFRA_00000917 [Hymenoscyphus fraxineus]
MPQPWKNGLFNCMPCGLCLKGCCCTCVLVGQNHERIKKNEPNPETFNGWCMGWCGLQYCFGVGWILQMIDRQDMNDKYDLEGSSLGACCTAFCCACCEAIQTKKELDYRELNQGNNAQIPTGYHPNNEKMVAQPQEPHLPQEAHFPPQQQGYAPNGNGNGHDIKVNMGPGQGGVVNPYQHQ